ncbi:MAG: hypothetical protein ABL971_16960 [Vicinamibacterales bacterium]
MNLPDGVGVSLGAVERLTPTKKCYVCTLVEGWILFAVHASRIEPAIRKVARSADLVTAALFSTIESEKSFVPLATERIAFRH